MTENNTPFVNLGRKLKLLRSSKKATAAEVSGAVEIDQASLEGYESGKNRPSQDILMLLINYYGMTDDEAAKIWLLAGYEVPKVEREDDIDAEEAADALKDAIGKGHATVMMMAFDPRVMYSDGVDLLANKEGIVLNFTQAGTTGVSPRVPVSRIGMSLQQAKGLYEVLQKTLEQTETMDRSINQKQLPPSNDASNSKA